VLAGVAVGRALLRGERAGRGEVLLVLATALVVPPLALFAVWFAGWHALRHLARVGTAVPLGPVLRLSAAPSVVALTAVALLTPVLGSAPSSVLVVLLALTVPHAVVVARALGTRGPGRPVGPGVERPDHRVAAR
jgi:beta-carotene 15,15'-dioxygenase